MMTGPGKTGLDRLLRPSSIAVIGGGSWCENVIEQCQKIGFAGEIWPVHPTRATVGGLLAYRDVDQLPCAPDASFIGINRDRTIDTVRALARRGAGGAVCFASGFREAQAEAEDGATKQDDLIAAAGDMTMLGPNCYGLLNYVDGVALWPDQHGGQRVEKGVALVTQSSNIAINLTMQARGLPVAYVITVGNQAQTGLSRVSRALLQDDSVTALGLHIEGIDDLRAFEALAAEAHACGKPIVAVKIGTSEQARHATVSHTASLSGSEAGAKALLARLGIGQVASLSALLETLKLLHTVGPLSSNRIASMSCSGGEASLMADAAHGRALEFPPLIPPQEVALRNALGPRVALANPLDYHTYVWGDVDAMSATFSAMIQGDLAMGCVMLDFPRADRCDASAWEPVIDAVARTKTETRRPMAIVGSLPENLPEGMAQRLVERGIVPFNGLDDALTAMEVAASLGQPQPDTAPLLLPPSVACARVLSEAQAKRALAGEGVPVPKSFQATCADGAANAATQIGYPVVLKGEGVAHKTEMGAVALNLQDAEAVIVAAEAMPAESYLVEEMVSDTLVELLIGVVADPAHGYVLTLAAGGIATELLDDSVSLLVPADRTEVRAALGQLRMAPLLTGYRKRPAPDMDAILDAVMAVQRYVSTHLPLEVETNPLLCTADRVVAADALIRMGE